MSSVPEKSNLLREKRSFFMRSGSFEKLKCSAKYPFRVVGVKLSKASVVQLAESIIARSRLLSQRLLLVLFIIVYKAICAALSILVRTSANPLSVVAVCDKQNKNTTLGFYERLQIKVEKLQKHKKRLDSLNSFDEISGQIIRDNVQILKNQQSTPPIIATILSSSPTVKVTTNLNNFNNNNTLLNNNNNKDDEFHAEIKRLRKLSTEKSISSTNLAGKIQQLSEINLNRNVLEMICLYPLVYGSILIMLYQIYVLGCILNSTTITLGYIFLIGSLGMVGVILFKVFSSNKFHKIKTTSNQNNFNQLRITDQQNNITVNKNSNNLTKTTATEETSTTEGKRQSRSRLKKDIDLSSKTLNDEFHAEIKRLRKLSTEKSISSTNLAGKIQQLSEINLNRNVLEMICLYPLVYGSILIMLYQIYVLGCILNSTTITLGYIFLIGSLGMVGVILFKVFSSNKFHKIKTTSNQNNFNQLRITDQQNNITVNKNSNNLTKTTATEETSTTEGKRQSRSRLKKDIDLSSKTLSKIKLL